MGTMNTKPLITTKGRIRGSANGARIAGLILWSPAASLMLAGILTTGYIPTFYVVPFVIITPFLLLWPWFMGVKIRGDKIVIVSWLWVYSLTISDIEDITWWSYSGVFNRGGDDTGWDPLQVWTKMLVITRKGRMEKEYSSTIGSRKRLMLIVRELRKAASLPMPDLSESRSKRHLSTQPPAKKPVK